MIIRRRHTSNFTTVGNKLLDDERLAADEVGVLVYLLSRPNDWEVRRPALMKRWGIGREALRRIIRNLVQYGYCRAERKRQEKTATTYMIYEIRDEPGPELTEEEAKRALALESSAATSDQIDGETGPTEVPIDTDPVTGQPSPARPPPADPSLAYKDIPNKDLTKDDSTQKIEREGAREKEKHARNLVEFKRRWPTNASDDQAKVDSAWFALTFEQGEAALAGIAPFLEKLKQDGRKHPPAGFTYLNQKRWELIDPPNAATAKSAWPRDSLESKALAVLHDIAGVGEFFRKVYRRSDGTVDYRKPVTVRLLALAQAPPASDYATLDHKQAGAWEGLLREFVTVQVRKHLVAGNRAPWPWPPSSDGKIYTSTTGPPEVTMTEQDLADFK